MSQSRAEGQDRCRVRAELARPANRLDLNVADNPRIRADWGSLGPLPAPLSCATGWTQWWNTAFTMPSTRRSKRS
jgi:hypothetical protein